jgi:RHS repeat-associated protein
MRITTAAAKRLLGGRVAGGKDCRLDDLLAPSGRIGEHQVSRKKRTTNKFSSNYVPYGNNYAVSGKEVFMYTGKPNDAATGLHYEGARYYDSTMGRFITQDSVTGIQDDPMSLNRYIYARDNPIKIVDLAGHEW